MRPPPCVHRLPLPLAGELTSPPLRPLFFHSPAFLPLSGGPLLSRVHPQRHGPLVEQEVTSPLSGRRSPCTEYRLIHSGLGAHWQENHSKLQENTLATTLACARATADVDRHLIITTKIKNKKDPESQHPHHSFAGKTSFCRLSYPNYHFLTGHRIHLVLYCVGTGSVSSGTRHHSK